MTDPPLPHFSAMAKRFSDIQPEAKMLQVCRDLKIPYPVVHQQQHTGCTLHCDWRVGNTRLRANMDCGTRVYRFYRMAPNSKKWLGSYSDLTAHEVGILVREKIQSHMLVQYMVEGPPDDTA